MMLKWINNAIIKIILIRKKYNNNNSIMFRIKIHLLKVEDKVKNSNKIIKVKRTNRIMKAKCFLGIKKNQI